MLFNNIAVQIGSNLDIQQTILTCNIAIDKFKARHIIIFLMADYHLCVHNIFAAYTQNTSVMYYIDAIKHYNQRFARKTDDKFLD